ncbi:MAG: hypothetical protein JXA68_04750, partial [Ignavibacteriales bacterium]|nr:hypothetical protein [Ignavibacteriales bacterium]
WSINFIAIILPWVELFIGIFILFDINIKENVFIAGILFVLFDILILIAILRGLDIDCGCFGTAGVQKVGFTKIAENLLFLIFCINLFLFDKANISIIKNNQNE